MFRPVMERAWDPVELGPFPALRSVYELVDALHVRLYLFELLLTVYFFHRVCGASRIHLNFRLVLLCAALSFVSVSGFRLLVFLILDAHPGGPQGLLWVNCACLVLGSVQNSAIASSALCMNMLAVEQWLATRWVEDYERMSMKTGLILMAIVFAQSIPLGIFINYHYVKATNFDVRSSFRNCIFEDDDWLVPLSGFVICVITCFGCSMWLLCLKRLNAKRKRHRLALSSLSARYQQTENWSSNSSIAPSLMGYFICGLIGTSILVAKAYLITNYSARNVSVKIANVLAYMTVDMYAVYHMFCFLFCNPVMRGLVLADAEWAMCGGGRILARCRRKLSPEYTLSGAMATQRYFQDLERAWA